MLSPGTTFPDVDLFNLQDKAVHWLVFVIQAYLWAGIGIKEGKQNKTRVWLNFLIFGIATGIVLEYLQQYIPYRTFDYLDMIVNVIGAITGLLINFKWPSIKMILE